MVNRRLILVGIRISVESTVSYTSYAGDNSWGNGSEAIKWIEKCFSREYAELS